MVIDRRFPSWRGWRSVMADIDWRHYDKIVERNAAKALDSKACSVVQSMDDEALDCLS